MSSDSYRQSSCLDYTGLRQGAAVRYVHRVGRTARMGKVGEALLFLMPSERAYLAKLEARGVHPRPLNVLPALDLLPADTTQQVGLLCRGAVQPQLPGCFSAHM